MKIEGNRPEMTPDVKATETVAGTSRAPVKPVAAREGDRVELSGGAALLARATQAANDLPDIRQDVVDQMREAIATGETGFDPLELADKIIDDLLEK